MLEQAIEEPVMPVSSRRVRTRMSEPAWGETSVENEPRTPYLKTDLNEVRASYQRLTEHLPGIEIYYAMKCNPEPSILKTVLECGGQFEISSAPEMYQAIDVGADPDKILFSNPIKSLEDIKSAYAAGVAHFAFDSRAEVDKLAEAAPGARVYARIAVPVRKSAVASEGKFGVSLSHAQELLLYAKSRGLEVYGLSFHVGSQMLDHGSWGHAIEHSSKLMHALKADGVELRFLDIGGGFPACYDDVGRDNIDRIGATIREALAEHIPEGTRVVAEPGRYMVAGSGTMVSSVIGVAERYDRKWLHLDVGAFNGMMEALETGNTLAFPVRDCRDSPEKDIFTLTGPTCDSQDTVLFDVQLSSDMGLGDQVHFDYAGAYTTAFTGRFNGFPNPSSVIWDSADKGRE